MELPYSVIAMGYQFVEAPRVADDGTIYFSDLTGGGYFRYRPGRGVDALAPERLWIGGAVLDEAGAIVLSGKGGIVRVDLETGHNEALLCTLDGKALIAVNDIEADRHGGIFGGSIDFGAVFERGEAPAGGQLFYLRPDGSVRILREGLTASNGMAFSPDGRLLYHSETGRGVWAYAIDAQGMPGRAELFAALPDSDGLVVDCEGGIYVACWQSAQILRYRPDGVLERRVTLPFPHLVSLCFGGPDMTDLYVATGGNAEHPGQGGIVCIKADIPGLTPFMSKIAGSKERGGNLAAPPRTHDPIDR